MKIPRTLGSRSFIACPHPDTYLNDKKNKYFIFAPHTHKTNKYDGVHYVLCIQEIIVEQ